MFKKVILATALISIFGVSLAADISGTYVCNGHDPRSNLDYHGALIITKDHNFYKLSWVLGDGEESEGQGFVRDNSLSAAYLIIDKHDSATEPKVGIETYTIDAKTQELKGYWLEHDQEVLGTETCKRHR